MLTDCSGSTNLAGIEIEESWLEAVRVLVLATVRSAVSDGKGSFAVDAEYLEGLVRVACPDELEELLRRKR